MSQFALFDRHEPRWERLDVPDADARMLHGFLNRQKADSLFRTLHGTVNWRQDTILFYGKTHTLPRLQQWYGDPGLTYAWSGIRMMPEPWSATLLEAKRKVEEMAEAKFNTVLLNLYRNGEDIVAWHADDEKDLVPNAAIASVSLGAERDFVLRHRTRKDVKDVAIPMTHGSLLLMAGTTQQAWLHSLPRRKGVKEPRINLTFRSVALENTTRRP